jgi:pyruvate dehydrogenase E2 component (dihydrolipoyllysine-residue acetyltransferase)
MAVDVIMPQMGESIFEGTITRWLKKPGDRVERDEPLFEISTDKVDAEIPAPSAGVLKEIKVNEGQTVPIQTVVAVIDAAGAQAAASPAPAASAPAPATAAPAPKAAAASAAPPASSAPAPATPAPQASAPVAAPSAPAAGGNGQKIRSSPLVRKLAKEHNVDLAAIEGSGAGGRISKRDILAAVGSGGARPSAPAAASSAPAGAPAAAPAPPPPGTGGAQAHPALENAVPRERIYFGSYEAQPMSVMRQRIAEHMVASKRVSPHVYSIDEADMTKIAKMRERSKAAFEEKYGTKLTFMPFFVRACVQALRAFPTVNASADGANVVLHREINVGIAVALDWGLIVPVLKNAEEKNFLGLARGINDLAERARSKKLKPEEVQESTFSITNPGVYGGLMGLPVISQPNVAILGIGAIQKRPVVIDDAIAIRSMVYLTLSYDHRVVDGAVAHQFLAKIKALLEAWAEEVL